jgi:hypothetical protein
MAHIDLWLFRFITSPDFLGLFSLFGLLGSITVFALTVLR